MLAADDYLCSAVPAQAAHLCSTSHITNAY